MFERRTEQSAAQRLQKQAAAHESWAVTADRTTRTQPGRDAWQAKLEAEVDPAGTMSPKARRQAAESKRKAHLARMSALGVAARQKKKSQKNDNGRPEQAAVVNDSGDTGSRVSRSR